MNKIFVHAYLAGNLGDDLLVRILCTRYPNTQFRMIASPDYKERFSDMSNVKVYSPGDSEIDRKNNFFKKYFHKEDGFRKFLIKTSTAVVHIGGSVFTQHFEDWSAFYHVDAELLRLSKRLYVIGANFGPYTNPDYYNQYHDLFQKYSGICFRDSYSAGLFPDLPNITWAPDVAFNYKINAPASQKQVAVSLISLKNRDGKYSISKYYDCYLKFMASLITLYMSDGYHIIFVSFCSQQGDLDAISDLLALVDFDIAGCTSICSYDKNMEECIQAFAESEIVIGTRFHSVILGWLFNKKVLPIIYNPKTLHLLEDNDCPYYLELSDLEYANPTEVRHHLDSLPPFESSALKQAAANQFASLDSILK